MQGQRYLLLVRLDAQDTHSVQSLSGKSLYKEFIRQNPQDPLSRVAQGRISGLRIDAEGPPGFEDLLFLALHPQLDRRLATFGKRPISHAAFHEAFHRLQEYLLPEQTYRLSDPQVLEQLREIIRKGNGNYEKGMTAKELQVQQLAATYRCDQFVVMDLFGNLAKDQ